MKRILLLFFVGMIASLSSCSSKNLMKYYYSINQKVEVKVYKYVNPKEEDATEYWKVSTNPDKGTILTESFDSEFNLYNIFEEKVGKDKAELIRYIEYEGEATNEIKATIKENQVYNSNKLVPYNYAVNYTNEYGRIIFEKKRQFLAFEDIEIRGRKYRTAKFEDMYFVDVIDQGYKYDFSQITYYSKGIGMVKYARFISPTVEIKILEFDKVLTGDEFEKMLNAKN